MSSRPGVAHERFDPKNAAPSGPIVGPMEAPWLTPETARFIDRLRGFACRGLAKMYRSDRQSFVFRLRRQGGQIVEEGSSRRYTAITLIGLASESVVDKYLILAGSDPRILLARLHSEIASITNLGDAALTLWAAAANGFADCERIRKRVLELDPITSAHPTVELAWALSALCLTGQAEDICYQITKRLIAAFNETSALFPHVIGQKGSWFRRHVCCFADQVYPIHALSQYFSMSGEKSALHAAELCAARICHEQGEAGQWWWHYDYRNGHVIEKYPVYAVHQDAMAPMALFALRAAGGPDFTSCVQRGIGWLAKSPELGGGTLVDKRADLIWRKVARREPRKFTRYAQAVATRTSPSLRLPGIDAFFPPCAIDFEARPYHLGWLLYAWPARRIEQQTPAINARFSEGMNLNGNWTGTYCERRQAFISEA